MLFCAQNLDAHLEKAVRETPTYITFLCQLLDAESEARKQRSEETRLKLSRLPQKKTLADSDFSFQPGLDERLIRELETLQFIHNHENVVLLGPPGVGKSHIAIGLATEAIRQGLSVYFVSMNHIIADLKRPHEKGVSRGGGKCISAQAFW